MTLAICAIFKNEAPYLREWIEFHRMMGVERFVLYQNQSTDDWQTIVAPYVEAKIVEIIDWPMLPPTLQRSAYQDFIDRYRGWPWWVAFIDCDEFLFSGSYQTVSQILEDLPRPGWGALGVNWMCFGASGHERYTDGPVIERFTLRPPEHFGPNRHIKSIVRMDHAESVITAHHFRTRGGTFSESGQQIAGPFRFPPTHTWLRINHYHTKSREEYLQRISRGRAGRHGFRSPSEFEPHQVVAADDRTIWKFLPALKERLGAA